MFNSNTNISTEHSTADSGFIKLLIYKLQGKVG